MNRDSQLLFDILIDNLIQLRNLQEQIIQALSGKQRAMRTGDMDALESWSAREKFLIDKARNSEQASKRAAYEFARTLGFEGEINITQLTSKLQEPNRSRLLALAGAVRSSAERVHHMNQINDEVTRQILCCFADIQRQITAMHCDTGIYDTTGQKKIGIPRGFLDAVG